jgi:hypothetical protein
VVRYINGTLDTTFDVDGRRPRQSELQRYRLRRRHPGGRQDRGQRVLAIGSDNDVAVVRYMPNGTLDTSFDTDAR